MTKVMEKQNAFVQAFEDLEQRSAGTPSQRLCSLRKEAFARFMELGFPTTRQEEWQYTNVSALAGGTFVLPTESPDGRFSSDLREFLYLDIDCNLLVFVNGRYSRELSSTHDLPEGVLLGSLGAALESHPALLEAHLARHAPWDDHPFAALNSAFIEDGAFLYLPTDTRLDLPVHLLFLSAGNGEPIVSHPRNLIVTGKNCRATVIESFAGLARQRYWSNPVTEILVGEDSAVTHCKIQRESETAFHVAGLGVRQSRGSRFSSHSFSLGAELTRNDLRVLLDGEGGECTLNGLYLVDGEQHVDNHTTIDHAKPHCDSRELYKGILDGNSSAVFNGRIIVRKDAQKTNSRQTNKNLLLSEDATINTKPQLEILADDVKCAHGATIGQLDENALYYLRTRGIDEVEARNLLVKAFGSDVVNLLDVKPIQCQLDLLLLSRLAHNRPGKESA